MNLLPEIANRVTVRSFLDEPVEHETVERILEAGRLAPSAKNRQPWRFIVLKDPRLRASMKDLAYGDERIEKAPLVIAACTTNIGYRMPNGETSYPIDLSFAVSHMMFQAEHEGLGTSVVTTFRQDEIKNLLTIPYSMKVVMLLLAGKAEKPADKESRLPLERIVSYDHW